MIGWVLAAFLSGFIVGIVTCVVVVINYKK